MNLSKKAIDNTIAAKMEDSKDNSLLTSQEDPCLAELRPYMDEVIFKLIICSIVYWHCILKISSQFEFFKISIWRMIFLIF